MSSDWQTLSLGDVAEFVRGINFKPDDVVPTGTPGSVACMRTKNVQAELELSDVWSVGEQFVRREDQFLQAGDILVSSANSWNLVGKCCWIPELPGRASFGGFVSVLRPHRAKVDPRFLFRWFSSNRIQTTLRSFGQQTTNISNLNTDRCLRLEIPLPPLAEQRRIAEVLDKAEALRAKRRAAHAELESLTQSLFLDLFGDPTPQAQRFPIQPLETILQQPLQNGAYYPKESYTEVGGVEMVHMSDAFYDVVPRGKLKRVNCSKPDLEKYALTELDILIARRSLTIEGAAKPCLIPKSTEPLIFESSFIRVTPHPAKLTALYLYHYLGNERVKQKCVQPYITQSTISGINQSNLERVPVLVPPLDLQHEFARRVTAVEKLKTAQRAALAELDALFASLQHRAFRGEL